MNHQPYIFENSGGLALLFCNANVTVDIPFNNGVTTIVPWKIQYSYDLDTTHGVDVATVAEFCGCPVVIECNPHLYKRRGKWYLCYVAGLQCNSLTPVKYVVLSQRIDINTMELFGTPELLASCCFSGAMLTYNGYFVTKDRKALKDQLESFIKLSIPFDEIIRVVNVFNSSELVLTLRQGEDYRTVRLDLAVKKYTAVKNLADEEVYKGSVYSNKLAYAVRTGPSLEDREIVIETL